ncbi:type IV secretory system conjugative DNA transfer family protein [Streptomyces sp. SID13666]|uniref:type IV secretory system conjugative DNA transfer family protein n=1 Tax=Streptomyces sp. SID13666 TaxID=2706054 RepID=UPI0013C10781|nr:type IV secretory system conjugative DNA transfer family protein [Streptomyces sp. SID13666]NEA56397.1 type IV secretory system conjugative DNA transfer family protein [Streptomyces sp. SID13666]
MSYSAFVTISAAIALLSSAIFLGRNTMRSSDDSRVSYRLTFPAELAAAEVAKWLNAVSGTLRSGTGHLLNVPTMVFESWATDLGITHRIRVPKASAAYIVPQLRSLVPGMTVTPEDDEPEHQWTTAVELGQTNPSRTLNIPDAEALSTSVLANMQSLGRGEALLVQWVVRPAAKEALPKQGHEVSTSRYSVVGQLLSGGRGADKDEIADRRAKLSEPNFIAVLRVAAKAADPRRAAGLLMNVRDSLTSVHSVDNRFKKRLVTSARLMERIKRASGSVLYPAKLSTTELVSLISWPIGRPHIAGLPRSRTRHLPATGAVLSTGRVMARSNFPGASRLLALDAIESAQHLQVVGPTGSGKTALLSNLIVQDMEAGRGVILIESKGDLFQAALERVPKKRLHDVVLLDVTDTDHPVGFNILQGSPYVVAADIQRLFDHLYPQDARGVRVRQGFYHLILTLLMSEGARGQMTFADMGALSVPRANQQQFSDDLIQGVSHIEELAHWWQEITALPRPQRELYFKPLSDRTWQLNNRRSIRNIIGQSSSTIDLREVIRGNKILLVNLGRATEGKETAGLLGSLLLNSIWSAVQSGVANPARPTMLYLDEFQDFLNLPISPADMFAQARSLGLAMTVAHQFLGQLTKELQDATQNNARSTVVFQTSADEARSFARQFGRSVAEDDFTNQARFEVIMRLATATGVSAPMTAVTLPPRDPSGLADQVRELSRKAYGRPVVEVEEEITRRRGTPPLARAAAKKRKFGGKAWNE